MKMFKFLTVICCFMMSSFAFGQSDERPMPENEGNVVVLEQPAEGPDLELEFDSIETDDEDGDKEEFDTEAKEEIFRAILTDLRSREMLDPGFGSNSTIVEDEIEFAYERDRGIADKVDLIDQDLKGLKLRVDGALGDMAESHGHLKEQKKKMAEFAQKAINDAYFARLNKNGLDETKDDETKKGNIVVADTVPSLARPTGKTTVYPEKTRGLVGRHNSYGTMDVVQTPAGGFGKCKSCGSTGACYETSSAHTFATNQVVIPQTFASQDTVVQTFPSQGAMVQGSNTRNIPSAFSSRVVTQGSGTRLLLHRGNTCNGNCRH